VAGAAEGDARMTIHETADEKSARERAAVDSELNLLAAMRAAMEAGKIAQRMVDRLLNAVIFLGIVNVVLMIALILQASR
jgi:hypothetical protein